MKQLPSADTHLDAAQSEEVFGWILDGEASEEEINLFGTTYANSGVHGFYEYLFDRFKNSSD